MNFVTNKVKGLFGAAPPPDLPKIRNENEAFIDGKFTNVACIKAIYHTLHQYICKIT